MTTWVYQIDWDRDNSFTTSGDDISADVKEARWDLGIKTQYGNTENGATARLTVHNNDGKYNPDNASGTYYGKLLPQTPVRIRAIHASGTADMFRGWIKSISPGWEPEGANTGKTIATIECFGIRDLLQNTEVNLPLQEDTTTSAIVDEVLGQVVLPPAVFSGWILGNVGFSELGSTTTLGQESDYSDVASDGRDVQYYGDIRDITKDDEPAADIEMAQTASRVLRDMAESEPGRFFQARDGRATFQTNATLLDYTAAVGTVDSSDLSGIRPKAINGSIGGDIVNQIQVTAYPRETETAITLWELDEPITLAGKEVKEVVAKFTDSNDNPCGALGPVTISAVTSINSTSNVSSFDQRADRVIMYLENTARNADDRITALSISGTALMANNSVNFELIEPASIATYGRQPQIRRALRAVSRMEDAEDIADLMMTQRSPVEYRLDSITFRNAADNVANAHQINWAIGDRIRVQISEIGHDAYYFIIGESHHVTENGLFQETEFNLERHNVARLAYLGNKNRDNVVLLADATDNNWFIAQSFQSSVATTLSKARLLLSVYGHPAMSLVLRLYDSAAGASGFNEPDDLLATSDAVLTENMLSGMHGVNFTFASPYSLSASTEYWLRLEPMFVKRGISILSNLVSWWPLEEKGGTRYDVHGSNDLSDNATVTSDAGKLGDAGQFTAANSEYLSITDAAQSGLDITGDISIAAWVRLDSLPSASSDMTVAAKYGTAGNRSFLLWVDTTDEVYFGVSDDGTAWSQVAASTFGALSINTWYFVCARSDGTNVSISINDGTVDTTAHSTGIYNSATPFHIGADNTGSGNYFNGRIDEVAIWSRDLTNAEVTTLYNSGNGESYYDLIGDDDHHVGWGASIDTASKENLVSYWKLDDSSGNAPDAHGSNNLDDNATVGSKQGIIDSARWFQSANSEFFDIADGDHSGLDLTTAFTFAGWVYPHSTGAYQAILSKWLGTGNQRAYLLRIENTDVVTLYVSDDGAATTSISASTFGALSANTWYFVCARYDGTNLKLRINATDQADVAYSSDVFDSTADFNIGAADGANWPMDGRIDEVAIWSRALSDAEVSSLYNAGAGLPYGDLHDGYTNGELLAYPPGWAQQLGDGIFSVFE